MRFTPKRSLGQNFLSNPRILDRIVQAAEVNKNDVILEVGPGTGNLTKKLTEGAGKVIAVEKDLRLIPTLNNIFKDSPDVSILAGDILKFDPQAHGLDAGSYKIVANIPYYITSNFLRKVFETWPRPALMVLMVQEEVALRIVAKPPHMNILALSVQYYSDPKIIARVSKNNFHPAPEVDSAIIRLKLKESDPDAELFDLIKAGFSSKRKQLAGLLAQKLKIDKENILKKMTEIGLSPTARPENLSLDNWRSLEHSMFK